MTEFLPPFPGFRAGAFAFLRELADHNDRDWFRPRKQIFEDELLWPLQCLVADVARELQRERIPLTGDPKTSIYRIYRDTRFSKNKTPYKTHVSALFSRGGTRKEDGSLYVHVQPGRSFLGAGFWEPDTRTLHAWRTRMARDPAEFGELAEQLEEKGFRFAPHDEPLKRLPRGFEHADDSPAGPYLRWKSFLVTRPLADEALARPDFTRRVVEMARDVRPFLEYGWSLG